MLIAHKTKFRFRLPSNTCINIVQFLLKLVPQKFLNVYSTRSQVEKGHFGGLIFLIFAIGIEKFNVRVSFRLEFSYIGLGGGGRVTALIGCAAASLQLRMVVRGTKDNIIDIKQ